MQYKTFKKIKILTASFVSVTVAMAVVLDNMLLAFAGVIIGVCFLMLVQKRSKLILIDERVQSVSGYAARTTYIILTVFIAFLSLVFTGSGRRTGEIYVEALGMILSYITLLSIAIYSISYKYFDKKYGAENDKQD